MVGAVGFSLPFVALSTLGAPRFWIAVALSIKPVAHFGSLVVLRRYPKLFRPVFHSMFAADLTVDLAVTVLLGGLFASSLQIGWSLIVVLGSLVVFSLREAVIWTVLFLVAVVVAAASSSIVEPLYEITYDPEIDGAFTLVGVTIVVFLVMAYFVRQWERYRRQSDDLLHSILPDEIADQLRTDPGMIADQFDEVSVLFADVVDFTPMSSEMAPKELVGLLNEVFTDIDRFVGDFELEKIKTVGDEYMVAAGVPKARADHASAIADLAANKFRGHQITFRIGINSGSVVAGIIGQAKFSYDLWGDVVNIASRMESQGAAGQIQISAATQQALSDDFICERRGDLDVKGKGIQETWFLIDRHQPDPRTGNHS
jgi:adenylate cyclase